MNIKRMWHSFRLMAMPKWPARKKYLLKHNIYGMIGENSHIQSPFIPLYAELIHLHNNVVVAKDVMFVTHDLIHRVANRMDFEDKLSEGIGCIEILDNVFVGAKSIIMPNVRIGPNAIVAAGSVVTKDVPENSIVGGVPAKVIGKFDESIQATILKEKEGRRAITTHNQNLTRSEIENAWKMFRENREKK